MATACNTNAKPMKLNHKTRLQLRIQSTLFIVLFIGVTGLTFEGVKPPEIGYWLGEPYWGRGYATEATRGLIEAVRAAGIAVVCARALAENKGSRGVLMKLGFTEIHTHIGDCGPHKNRQFVEMRLEFGS